MALRRKKINSDYDGSTPLNDPKQEFFTELYTASFTQYYGHGQNSYAFAYGHQKRLDQLHIDLIGASNKLGRGKRVKTISDYDGIRRKIKSIEATCKSCATDLLTRPYILKRVRWRLDEAAQDIIIDQEAMRVVQQMNNLDAKMRAVERFDKIRGRVREKVDIKHEFEPIQVIKIAQPKVPLKK